MGPNLSRGMSGGGFPEPPTSKLFRNIAVTFVLIAIAVIAIAVWTSTVRADIHVTAKPKPVAMETEIEIATSPGTQQLKGHIVSGSFVESMEVPVEKVSSSTAVVSAHSKTQGRVRIRNNYSKKQPLVKTTRLLTADNKLFRITENVEVPAGGSMEVDAISDEAGGEFVIPSGVRMTIPGLWIDLQELIYAESITAFKGEGGGAMHLVTAEAMSSAYDTLYTNALEKAKGTLELEAGADPEWESIFIVTDSKKQANAAVGQEAERFLAQVRIEVTGVFFPKEDIIAFVRTRLNEKVPEGYILSEIDLERVLFRLEEADKEKGIARLSVSAEAESRLTEDSPFLRKDQIVGLPQDEVVRKWSALDGVETVDITVRPQWVQRLPSMKDKINVYVE